jgi:Protein of unknown function (DUF3040)
MLDRHERDRLREIERQITAADPKLAALLRDHRRPRPQSLRVTIALLVLLAVALLVLGLPGSAVVVGAVAATWWWLAGFRIAHQQ